MSNDIICVNEIRANRNSVPYGILFLSIAAAGLYFVVRPIYQGTVSSDPDYLMIAGAFMVPMGFMGGMRYFYTSRFYFDRTNFRYKHVDGYGPFKSGTWKSIGTIEYVSVFRQFYADQEWENEKDISIAYDVNLWYNENRCITLTSYNDSESAFKFARRLAIQLQINLLDATVPNDYQWVENKDNKEYNG